MTLHPQGQRKRSPTGFLPVGFLNFTAPGFAEASKRFETTVAVIV